MPITYGIMPFVSPSTDTFCQHTMGTEGVFTIEDAHADPRFRDIGWVDGTIAGARFYASAPLYAPSGAMVGRLCVIDPEVKTLTALQRGSLETLATNVTQLIELRMLRSTRPALSAPESGQVAATVVSQLAAELSHDLRVPLSSITASVEMLADELEDRSPFIDALLKRAVRATERMSRMLDQSMEYGAAGEEPDLAEVHLGQVAQQLVLNSADLLDATGATVETADLPVVHADPDDMYSVLQNLLTNSVKFARPGVPVQVQISARKLPDAWRISFHDNGVGIPQEHRVDVFSLFTRIGTTSRATASAWPRSRGSSAPTVAASGPSRSPAVAQRSGSRSPTTRWTPTSGVVSQYAGNRQSGFLPRSRPGHSKLLTAGVSGLRDLT